MKTGIIFEGGANRAIFSCGVMDALLEHDIMPDYIIGVSAGAAYGVSYAAKQRGRNMEIFERYVTDKRYASVRNMLDQENRSYFGLKFVYETVPRRLLPFDYESFDQYKGEFYAAVTNAETGKPAYFQVNGCDMDRQRDILKATCALPILFPPIYIDGVPYMDGGLSDSVPIRHAMASGCDRIVVVLTRPEGYRKTTSGITRLSAKVYKKKYPLLSRDLFLRAKRYNKTMEQIEKMEQAGELIVIRPTSTKGIGRTEKDMEKLRPLYEDGLEKGRSMADRIQCFFTDETVTKKD